MPVKLLEVRNFRSFRHISLELGQFHLVIGSNASGKTNFIQAFKFLRDISLQGLNNAVSLQGGADFIRNVYSRSDAPVEFLLDYDLEEQVPFYVGLKGNVPVFLSTHKVRYHLILIFTENGSDIIVDSEDLILTGSICPEGENLKDEEIIGSLNIHRKGASLTANLNHSGKAVTPFKDFFICVPRSSKLSPKETLLFSETDIPGIPRIDRIFGKIKFFELDPRIQKSALPLIGRTELEEDTRNLALVLRNILHDPDRKKVFFNLLLNMLPFITDIEVENYMDIALFVKIREIYGNKNYLPSFLISDGTLNVIAIIIALYFDNSPVVLFEEPEKGIYPLLFGSLLDMFKEVRERRQILITTHHPEMLKRANIDEILMIGRDKDGFSIITRPADKLSVRSFIEHEIGIDELFLQDLLGRE